jgi:hypothetical protein
MKKIPYRKLPETKYLPEHRKLKVFRAWLVDVYDNSTGCQKSWASFSIKRLDRSTGYRFNPKARAALAIVAFIVAALWFVRIC